MCMAGLTDVELYKVHHLQQKVKRILKINLGRSVSLGFVQNELGWQALNSPQSFVD